MDNAKALQNRLLNRQIYVQRKNLVQICRFAVKSLIDKASLTSVDDDCEELVNFCAILERLMSHRLKAQTAWFTIDEEHKHFWGFIKAACQRVPNNCINSIANLENVRSPVAKGRAWIRCVLMEKRLSEYLSVALQQTSIIRKFYREGAVMLSEDTNMLCGVLLGLNAIDFSFCLKGNNLALSSPVEIDYTPYLRFQQSRESLHMDQEELQELSTNSSLTSSIMSEVATVPGETTPVEDIWKNKYKSLELKFKSVSEQKGYLEELGRLKDQQLHESQRQRQTLLNTCRQFEEDSKRERHQLEAVILELQKQLTVVKQQQLSQQQKYNNLLMKLQGGQVNMDEVAIATPQNLPPQVQEPHTVGCGTSESNSIPVSAARLATPSQTTGQLATMTVADQHTDSQSMIAMAGSFSSQASLLTSPELGRKLSQTSDKMQAEEYSGNTDTRETSPSSQGHVEEYSENTRDTSSSSQGQEEEYVIVPEDKSEQSLNNTTDSDKSQESLAVINVTDVSDSDQSQGVIDTTLTKDETMETANQNRDISDSVFQDTNSKKEVVKQLEESQDLSAGIPQIMVESAEADERSEEADDEEEGSSGNSDDIMILSDVSLADKSDNDQTDTSGDRTPDQDTEQPC